jgi:hypothetical protein
MPTSSHLAALATLALVLALASAQGPECKAGPHPSVLAVQQKCAKGSLLCKEVQVTNCTLILPTPPPPPPPNLKPPQSLHNAQRLTRPKVDIVSFNMDAPQTVQKVLYPSGSTSSPASCPVMRFAANALALRHCTGTCARF